MLVGYLLMHHYGIVKIKNIKSEWIVKEIIIDGVEPECMAVDPFDPKRIYVGTFNHGLWLSNDSGMTWKQAGKGIGSKRITSVAVSRSERVRGNGIVWVGTEPSELYRSEDGGKTFEEREALKSIPSRPTWSFPPRPETHHVRWIEPDRFDENVIFLGIELGGLMRSLDQGISWEDRKEGSLHDCHMLTMHPHVRDRIYEAAGGGFAQSRDGGESWMTENKGLGEYQYLVNLLVADDDPNCILVSASKSASQAYRSDTAHTTIFKKTSDGWKRIKSGLPDSEGMTMTSFAHSPVTDGTFYAVNNKGVFVSHDYGEHWQAVELDWPEKFESMRVKHMIMPKL
ncbi:WD40/YVTN/BNR-like repeat-containing protein [Aerococcaceae bacterium WGS1372]